MVARAPRKRMYRSMQGKMIDIDKLRAANENVQAVGNMKVNARGDVLQESKWAEAVCLEAKVNLNNTITFYSIYGDYFGRLSVFIAAILLIVSFVKARLNKKGNFLFLTSLF